MSIAWWPTTDTTHYYRPMVTSAGYLRNSACPSTLTLVEGRTAEMNEISERTETVLPEPARALGALVGVPAPDLARGEGLRAGHPRTANGRRSAHERQRMIYPGNWQVNVWSQSL